MEPAAPPLVRPFRPADTEGVAAVIVPIQQAEFGIPIRYEDQPDLLAIADFYQSGAGGFWVAEAADGSIVGTIGLRDIGEGMAALRKMFVAAGHRGDGTARRLLDVLIAHAKATGLQTVLLGTTSRFLAAHRFYEKNGFVEIAADELPASFPRIAVDTKFYRIQL